jgi:hypothetical protein
MRYLGPLLEQSRGVPGLVSTISFPTYSSPGLLMLSSPLASARLLESRARIETVQDLASTPWLHPQSISVAGPATDRRNALRSCTASHGR